MNKLTLLGTGCPSPSHLRYGPSSLVSYEGTNYLIDAGSGVTQRLSEAGIKPGEIDYFFITIYTQIILLTYINYSYLGGTLGEKLNLK